MSWVWVAKKDAVTWLKEGASECQFTHCFTNREQLVDGLLILSFEGIVKIRNVVNWQPQNVCNVENGQHVQDAFRYWSTLAVGRIGAHPSFWNKK